MEIRFLYGQQVLKSEQDIEVPCMDTRIVIDEYIYVVIDILCDYDKNITYVFIET